MKLYKQMQAVRIAGSEALESHLPLCSRWWTTSLRDPNQSPWFFIYEGHTLPCSILEGMKSWHSSTIIRITHYYCKMNSSIWYNSPTWSNCTFERHLWSRKLFLLKSVWMRLAEWNLLWIMIFVEICASHQSGVQSGQLCGVCPGPWRGSVVCLPAVGRSAWTDCANRERLCFHDWLPLPRLQRAGFRFGLFNLLVLGLYLETVWVCGCCRSSVLLTDEITDSCFMQSFSVIDR